MTNPEGGAVPAPFPTPRQNAGYFVLTILIFLVVFVASCGVLGRCLPFPEVSGVRTKLEFLAQHGDEYDVLFVGSSRVHSQIMPAIFDQIARENGVPVKSFNAGIAGMFSPEDGYVMDEIMRRPHRRLRWVFIELSRLRTKLERDETSRFGYWHDTARLMLVGRRLRLQAIESQAALARDPKATFDARWKIWSVALGDFWGHARRTLTRAINLGRGNEMLDRRLRLAGLREGARKSMGVRGDGWLAAPPALQQITREARKRYEQKYAERLASPAVKQRGDPVSQDALERLLATITNAGVRPVFIVPPTMYPENFYPTAERERDLDILDYCDVRQYPQLFAVDHRTDEDHLNTAGAELFTELIAHRFVELVKRRGQIPEKASRPGVGP